MVKYKKEIAYKAIYSLRKNSKYMFVLYMLRVIKIHDIVLQHEPYNYGATARFKFNWFNPITWIINIIYIIYSILFSLFYGLVASVDSIKQGIYIYFE